MKIISSYAVDIQNADTIFNETIKIYNDAISFCVKAFEDSWSVLKNIPSKHKERFQFAENLIHTTKKNKPVYKNFDILFKKLPSYLRRDVITIALGYVSSYHSNLKNWEKNGKKGNKPTFQIQQNKLPTFYRDNMYLEGKKTNTAQLKLFVKKDWVWVTFKLRPRDVKSIEKHKAVDGKMSAPTLSRKRGKWSLRFAFEKNVTLNDTPIQDQTVLAVDLGINTDATCSEV